MGEGGFTWKGLTDEKLSCAPPLSRSGALFWDDLVWYDMMWYDMIWYDMIWYDLVWYDQLWYGMISYGMIRSIVTYFNACLIILAL